VSPSAALAPLKHIVANLAMISVCVHEAWDGSLDSSRVDHAVRRASIDMTAASWVLPDSVEGPMVLAFNP
jgi:hypothetical protein